MSKRNSAKLIARVKNKRLINSLIRKGLTGKSETAGQATL